LNTQLFTLSSAQIDEHFGLRINTIEHELFLKAKSLRPQGDLSNLSQVLHDGHQTWVGLDPQTLQTPYAEVVHLCELLKLKAGEHLVDLGAGYGRVGLVLHHYNSGVRFTGYELVQERVIEGDRVLKQFDSDNLKLHTQDLMDPNFVIPEAQYYFLYDFGKVAHIRHVLKQLEERAFKDRFKIVARGKGSRSIIDHEHPWLSQTYPARHEENFSIYSMSL
jgi:protein-L-isoaspartate O-methyltransferase